MPFMVWNDRLSINVSAIDDDHRRMIETINELYDAIRGDYSKDVLGGILHRLVDYTQYHFEREENLFSQTAYPTASEHSREHADATAWIRQMRDDYAGCTAAAPSLKMISFLKDWLFDHILGSDHRFGEFLNSRGVH